MTERDHGLVDQMVTPYKNARDRTREREMVRELAALAGESGAASLNERVLVDRLPRLEEERAVLVVLGICFPLVGGSMLVIWLLDSLLFARRRAPRLARVS